MGILIPLITAKLGADDGSQFREKSGELSSFVLDSLRGMQETIQYQMGQNRAKEINQKTDLLAEDEEKMKKKAGRSMSATNTAIVLLNLLMLFLASLLYQNGYVDFDGVLVSTVALMSSYGPVIALAALGSTLQNTFAAGNRVLDILNETPCVEDISQKPTIGFSAAQADNLTFSYGGEEVLSDVSVLIPKHSIIGIVGKSGSGKSTLLKLMMRFWNIQKGSIKISDRHIDEINTSNLRDMESFVTQETHLFHDSIKNNIRIAKLDANDKE